MTEKELLVIRPVKVRRVAIGSAAVLVVVFSVIGALLKDNDTGVNFRTSDQVAMVLLGFLMAGAVLLFARPRLRADDRGIEVRNLLGTRFVEWDLVLRVSFPDGAPWARLDIPDDEYIPVMAIQASDGRHAVTSIRALREVHATKAQTPRSTGE